MATHNTQNTAQQQEAQIRALLHDDRTNDAVAQTLEFYGSALYGYIFSLARSHEVAEEVFQMASVDLWKGIAGFAWRSSLKTWAFTLSRNAWLRYARSPPQNRFEALSPEAQHALPAILTRTATQQWRKTEARHWLWEVVSDFPDEDQQLIRMRLLHKMSWKEIVCLLYEDLETTLTEDEINRKASMLRKRYDRLKNKLRDARAKLKT